ncbi:peroxisome- protein [Blyttiomyces sp. JEL0837]|nr:peroxisome- protein [Blyttiomyces sp. JEL0837]
MKCTSCGFNVHKKCVHLVPATCSTGRRGSRSSSIDQGGHFETQSISSSTSSVTRVEDDGSSLRSVNAATGTTNPINTTSSSKFNSSSSSSSSSQDPTQNMNNPPLPQQQKATLMTDVIAAAAASGINPEDDAMKKDTEPPLNLLTTTPRNFTRFVTRLTPVVDIFDGVTDVLSWKEPAKTLVALFSFILICLYPSVFIILPQTVLLYIISRNYYQKTKLEVVGPSNASGPSITATSSEYLRNMQFIQNQMGLFCDVHAAASKLGTWLDWSDEDRTLKVVQLALASSILVLAGVHFVPLNLIILAVGLFAFSANTALFRAASTTLPPALLKGIKERVDSIREGIVAATLAPGGTVITVVLFENQRWWAGLGWIPHLLRTERAPWSDETGNIQRPPKEMFELPTNETGTWTWVDPEWVIDMDWAEVDECGWQYSDHLWSLAKGKANLGSLTRRRAWMRKMSFVPNPVVGGVAKIVNAVSSS